MNQEKHREEEIFTAAFELPPEQRAAYLAEACAGDPQLLASVQGLLGALNRASPLLKHPRPFPQITNVLTANPGDKIGRYKLLEQIGEGGCGVVYVAEQEEPVRRRVALKIIKLGMDTKQVIARFDAERQALAMMDHPNIARIHDAGATESGRPYFVMELVRGIKITDYCEQHHLSPRERLDLFTQVCRAIQHAHQKGIIHRDIKPSNILVTSDDGVPVPKVIDFGIAKATQGRLTDQTIYTAFEQFIGTPAYMSPEQAQLSMQDIDTRSDIYSLGVLLYELLTGETPFDAEELLAKGLDEMRRVIREDEPVKPSTRLTQELAGAASKLPSKSDEKTRASSRRLLHEVRGDLDWIVMKCLEKDRSRRYETASDLCADVWRHLNCDPVFARPPSRLYRLKKSFQRNRLAFSATAAVLASLIIGLAVSSWMFFKEKTAYERAVIAEQEQIRLRRVAEKIPELIFMADGLRYKKYTDELNPDKLPEAESLCREALSLARSLYGEDHIQVAYTLVKLGSVLKAEGRISDAEECYRKALAISARLARGNNPATSSLALDGSFRLSVPSLLDELAGMLRSQKKLDEAEGLYAEYLPLLRARLPSDDYELAHALVVFTVTLLDEKKFAEAEPLARECLTFRNKQIPDDWRAFNARHLLGTSLLGQKKYAEAEPLLIESYQGMKQREKSLPTEGKQRLKENLQRLIELYQATGQPEKAAEWNKTLAELEKAEADKKQSK